MKFFNTIDDIYGSNSVVYDTDDEVFRCTVCSATFEDKEKADAHYDERKCHTAQNVFKNTELEHRIYKLYLNICAEQHIGHTSTLLRFRTKPQYKRLAKFFLFCLDNGIRNITQYAEYAIVTEQKKSKNPYHALSYFCDVRRLNQYRVFLYQNPSLIDSEVFFNSNWDKLNTDLTFVCRALERADIAYSYLASKLNLDALYQGATQIEKLRFDSFRNVVQAHVRG